MRAANFACLFAAPLLILMNGIQFVRALRRKHIGGVSRSHDAFTYWSFTTGSAVVTLVVCVK